MLSISPVRSFFQVHKSRLHSMHLASLESSRDKSKTDHMVNVYSEPLSYLCSRFATRPRGMEAACSHHALNMEGMDSNGCVRSSSCLGPSETERHLKLLSSSNFLSRTKNGTSQALSSSSSSSSATLSRSNMYSAIFMFATYTSSVYLYAVLWGRRLAGECAGSAAKKSSR